MNSRHDIFGSGLVLDASVVLNLLAVESLGPLVHALPPSTIVDKAAVEITRHPRTGERGAGVLKSILSKALRVEKLDDDDAQKFLELVSAAPPDDLDDGEAATLAYSSRRGLVCVIDERKALRVAKESFDGRPALTTVGLYRELLQSSALGRDVVAGCTRDSLRYGRMRVLEEDVRWVLELVGTDFATSCPSLRRHHRR
jgi:predicted nucleic acid-binding protein